MAELMCPGCKSTIPAGTPYCATCMLAPVPRSDAAADATEPVRADPPPPAAAEPADVDGKRCPDADCVHSGVVPAKPCRHCGRRAAAGIELVFPWGVEPLPPGQKLAVGREDSPLARNLAQYPNVSRRHAELAAAGGSVTVTDLGSANGTFVNDRRIEPRSGVAVRAGDRVRLAADLVILIRSGGAQ
jgi:hypothetical protein